MADDLNVVYKIAADISGLQDGVNRAAKSAESLQSIASTLTATLAGMFTVGTAIAFAKSISDDADALVKMSDRTGASIQGLQKLQVAGDDAGNTIEQMTGAINQLQNRLASGDDSAVSALAKLGLTAERLRAMKPDEAFIAISDAVRQIPDPTDQTRIAVELFGKAGAEILPTLKRGFDDLKDSVVGMSDETVRALDEAGDTIARWTRLGKGYAAEFLVAAVQSMTPFQTALNDQARAAENAAKHLADLAKETKNEIKAAEEYAKGIRAQAGPEEDAATHARIYADLLRKQADARRDAAEVAKRAAAETAKADQHYFDQVVALSNKLYDIENPMRDNIFLMGDLSRVGKQVSDGVKEITDAYEHLRSKLAKLERQGIPAVFTQGGLDHVGMSADALTEAQKKAIEAADAMNRAVANEFSRLPSMLAEGLRAGDFTALGRQMGEFIGSAIGGPIGAAIGSFLPEIGQHIADFFGHLFGTGGLFPNQLQKVMDAIARAKGIVDEQKAAADAAQRAADEIENAMHAGGARSNTELQHAADVARQAFEKALASGNYSQENLDKLYVAYQQALADAGSEAAKAWLKAHDATQVVDKDLQKLIDRRDELTKGISQEAPEAEMGVIEKQMRAERDALDEQIKNAQTAAQAQSDAQGDAANITKEKWGDTSKVLKDEMSAAGEDAAKNIKDSFGFEIHIPVFFDRQNGSGLEGLSTGGLVSGGKILHFDTGGVATASGKDRIPALLAEGEMVLTPGQQSYLGVDGSVPSLLVALLKAVQADRYTTVVIGEDPIARATHRAWDRNPSGLRTEARELLGVA